MKPFYEYLLKYPQGFQIASVDVGGVVFYVGKGTIAPSWTNVQRMDMHELEAKRGCTCQKCEVIRGVWAKGQHIDKEKAFEADLEYEVLEREQLDIQETYAGPYLTNQRHNHFAKVSAPPETEIQKMIKRHVAQVAAQIMREEAKKRRLSK